MAPHPGVSLEPGSLTHMLALPCPVCPGVQHLKHKAILGELTTSKLNSFISHF